MGLIDWLTRRAPRLDADAPMPHAPEARPEMPADAEDTEELLTPDESGEILLDELFTVIDYVDARGARSRRRITTLKLRNGTHGPLLSAICHERRALRHFRIDRVEAFIDPETGEVVRPPHFLRETLAVDPNSLLAPQPHDALTAARALREALRPGLSVLVLAARADEEFHDEELDVICRYAEREADALAQDGRCPAPDLATLDALTPMIRSMRPNATSLESHLTQIFEWPDDRAERLDRALRAVLTADGEIAVGEEFLIDEIAAARSRWRADTRAQS
ncbi:MAG: hypothetical protein ACOCYW_09935 [Roseicyclus sp.]